MTDLRTAAQLALEALEGGGDSWRLVGPAIEALKAALEQPHDCAECTKWQRAVLEQGEVIEQLKAALEQPEPEPVALPCCGYADASAIKWNPLNGVVQCHNCGQTYTHPPRREWRGLSDEEREAAIKWAIDLENTQFSHTVARAIEAKLKEKNT